MHVIGNKMLQLQLPLQLVNGCTPIDVQLEVNQIGHKLLLNGISNFDTKA